MAWALFCHDFDLSKGINILSEKCPVVLDHYTLSWSIQSYINDKYVEQCFLPYSWLVSRYFADSELWMIVMNAMDCLEKVNLMVHYEDGGWWREGNHYILYYNGNVFDFDYFEAICQYFRLEENRPKLLSTIVDCKFSNFT